MKSMNSQHYKNRLIKYLIDKGIFQEILAILVITLSIFSTAVSINNKNQNIVPRASNVPVTLFLSPESLTLATQTSISFMVNASTSQLGFIKAELIYDETKINISNTTINGKFRQIVKQTTDPNIGGRQIFVLGLDPSEKNNAPTGVFELARFTISRVGNSGDRTFLQFDPDHTQLVNINGLTTSVDYLYSDIKLNNDSIVGDVNTDGHIDILDYQLLSNSFGKASNQVGFNPKADFNNDHSIDILDFQMLSNNFGKY